MIEETEFTNQVLSGWTIKQLQEHYGVSRSAIYSCKTKWDLVGKTPNNKARVSTETGFKTCSVCKEEKSLSSFYANGYQPTGTKKYKGTCKTCQTIKDYQKKKQVVEDILISQSRDYSCTRCGYDKNTAALCFHHVDPLQKDFEIAQLSSYPRELLANEISKCIVLCHNCHMEEHYPHLNR